MIPEITIITPTWNREVLIDETLDSLVAQTEKSWECLVIDDGSSDQTEAVVKKYAEQHANIRWIARDRLPKGANTCRNIGIDQASGKFLVFLDSDDLLAPHCLEQRLKWIKEHPKVDIAVFKMQAFYNEIGDSSELLLKESPSGKSFLERFLGYDLPWITAQPIWRTEFIQTIGGFDEDMPRLQDPELHTRALLANAQVAVVGDAPIDSYYRKPAKHSCIRDETSHQRITTEGLALYFSKFAYRIEQADLPEDLRAKLRAALFPTLRHLVIKQFSKAKISDNALFKSTLNTALKYNYLPTNLARTLRMVHFAHQLNLHKIKGLGLTRATTWLDKKWEASFAQ